MKNKSYKYLLQQNGYCLIKNFFNINEVEKLRKFVLKNHHNDQDIYLSNNDNALDENLLSENILSNVCGDFCADNLPTNTISSFLLFVRSASKKCCDIGG